jgi:hypothetical protein
MKVSGSPEVTQILPRQPRPILKETYVDQDEINKAKGNWQKQLLTSNLASTNASTRSYSRSGPSGAPGPIDLEDTNYVIDLSMPPPDDEYTIDLQKYLVDYIEGYLIGDLDTLTKKVGSDNKFNCSFVIIMTICAGIEFLGLLLDTTEGIDDKAINGRSKASFTFYWKTYLSKYESKLNSEDAYNLVRNGLAHCFMVKHGVGTIRFRTSEHLSIGRKDNRNVLKIDADTFFTDFKNSYKEAKKILLDGATCENRAKMRLEKQLDMFQKESTEFINSIDSNDTRGKSSDTTTALDLSSISQTRPCLEP